MYDGELISYYYRSKGINIKYDVIGNYRMYIFPKSIIIHINNSHDVFLFFKKSEHLAVIVSDTSATRYVFK